MRLSVLLYKLDYQGKLQLSVTSLDINGTFAINSFIYINIGNTNILIFLRAEDWANRSHLYIFKVWQREPEDCCNSSQLCQLCFPISCLVKPINRIIKKKTNEPSYKMILQKEKDSYIWNLTNVLRHISQ